MVRSVGDPLRRALIQELNPEGRELRVARQLRETAPSTQNARRSPLGHEPIHDGIIAGARPCFRTAFSHCSTEDTAVFGIGGGGQRGTMRTRSERPARSGDAAPCC